MSGFFALLDDIATLAKLTVSTLDDTASMAVKTSAKVAAAAVDDVAATPQYVTGITPDRELPIIRRITRGSLRNKLLIILPIGLLLTWFAPAALPVALIIGGTYLCFEGGEKIWHVLAHRLHIGSGSHGGQHGEEDAHSGAQMAQQVSEDSIVRRAITTDFVLSTEIMLLALAEVNTGSSVQRIMTLILIAFLITFAVYGLVGLLIKCDDLGIRLAASQRTLLRRLGVLIVRAAPMLFQALSVIGTVAMLWVGGEILAHNLEKLGVEVLAHLLHAAEHLSDVPVLSWLAMTATAALVGAVIGVILAALFGLVRALYARLRPARAKAGE